jgi:hypothetical protein
MNHWFYTKDRICFVTSHEVVCRVPNQRLEDHIRELCDRVASSRESECEPAIIELRVALQEHTRRLRRLAAEKLAPIKSSVKERAKGQRDTPQTRSDA